MNGSIASEITENLGVLRKRFANSADVHYREIQEEHSPRNWLVIYCESVCDVQRLDESVIPRLLMRDWGTDPIVLEPVALARIRLGQVELIDDWIDVERALFRGKAVLIHDGDAHALAIDLAKLPGRRPEESGSEISVRGSRDGFTEELMINIGLIRKRLPTCSLCVENRIVGKRTKTALAFLYLSDVADPTILAEVRNRLDGLNIDGFSGSSGLEAALADRRPCFFPLLSYSGRPDFVVASLLRGRFAIVADGAPTVLLGPSNFLYLLQSAEDDYNSCQFVTWEHALRLVATLAAMGLPALYVAIVSFHPEQIPIMLLSTIITSTRGVPVPLPVSVFITILLFDLFREAGNRLPGGVGQTLGTVGGLIIGDAAMKAGLTSPSVIVIVAITAVATYSISNQVLAGVVTVVRLALLMVASFLGLLGLLMGGFALLTYLASLQSFGVPYLAPFSPLSLRGIFQGLIHQFASHKRPDLTRPKDADRSSEVTR